MAQIEETYLPVSAAVVEERQDISAHNEYLFSYLLQIAGGL